MVHRGVRWLINLKIDEFWDDWSGLRSVDWSTCHSACTSFPTKPLNYENSRIILSVKRRKWTTVCWLNDGQFWMSVISNREVYRMKNLNFFKCLRWTLSMIYLWSIDSTRQLVLQFEQECALCFFLVYLFCVCSMIPMRLKIVLQLHMAPKLNIVYFRGMSISVEPSR